MHAPDSVQAVAEFVSQANSVRVAGNGSKFALSAGANVTLGQMTGIVDYQPSEYVITAKAGTPIRELDSVLSEHHQYLPFDPPMVGKGATVGGTVASGLSGAARWRYGGLRDFLLACDVVTGTGELVRAGARVVKNAAGFDLPRLLIGSMGRFGVITSATFKVFPLPERLITVTCACESLADALDLLRETSNRPSDAMSVDVDAQHHLFIRLAGNTKSVQQRAERLISELNRNATWVDGPEETEIWRRARDFEWPDAETDVLKVPIRPSQIHDLCTELSLTSYQISAAGHVIWVAWPRSRAIIELGEYLQRRNLNALALTGRWEDPVLGRKIENVFRSRLTEALDPQHKFSQPLAHATSHTD